MPKGYDWAATPLDGDDAPCGPDLEATDDDAFVDWYYDSIGRLPERYLIRGGPATEEGTTGDRVFDQRSVDLKTEKLHADEILPRSRDLRVLCLMARWELLAGRGAEAASALDAIATLLETFPDAVHPVDSGDRRLLLLDLADRVTVIEPLLHLNIAAAQEVTLRRMRVATGEAPARDYETSLDASAMTEELTRAANRPIIEASAAAVDRMLAAIDRIAAAFKASPGGSSLDFSKVTETLTSIRALLTSAAPDLAAAPVPEVSALDDVVAEDAISDADQPVPTPVGAVTPPSGPNGARALLEACERYFRTHEPSSAALLLVTQARLLVGRPLMEALETLMPEDANRAVVSLGSSGFQLGADRLRSLSADSSLPQSDHTEAEDTPPPVPSLTNGAEVTAVLAAVEAHYAQRERSSPVPLLLARARATIGKDFHALIADLIPPEQN